MCSDFVLGIHQDVENCRSLSKLMTRRDKVEEVHNGNKQFSTGIDDDDDDEVDNVHIIR